MALDRAQIASRIEAHARHAAPDLVGPYAEVAGAEPSGYLGSVTFLNPGGVPR
jgi:hypothetical protein